jgi:hypothetical protein
MRIIVNTFLFMLIGYSGFSQVKNESIQKKYKHQQEIDPRNTNSLVHKQNEYTKELSHNKSITVEDLKKEQEKKAKQKEKREHKKSKAHKKKHK